MSVRIFLIGFAAIVGLSNLACVICSLESPCARLEVKNKSDKRDLIDIDHFFKKVRETREDKEKGKYKRLTLEEGAKDSDYYYKKCGGAEKVLTKGAVEELVNFLIMQQVAGRSLLHFTVLNCPLVKENQKLYIMETSKIHLCRYIFQRQCCSNDAKAPRFLI